METSTRPMQTVLKAHIHMFVFRDRDGTSPAVIEEAVPEVT